MQLTAVKNRIRSSRSRALPRFARYFSKEDIAQFKHGDHYKLYEKMGSHLIQKNGSKGVYFSVWAPHARDVSVIGDFNNWQAGIHCLNRRSDQSGIWEGFISGVKKGEQYRYQIRSKTKLANQSKIDPFAFTHQVPPNMSSVVWDLKYSWKDQKWLKERRKNNIGQRPISIYEVHLGSWRRPKNPSQTFLNYRQIADELIPHVKKMGFTHVEFLPVMEHPYYPSWGYQAVGFFAPTSRLGQPQDLMYLIDQLHQNDIGVILDWVPSHFPCDGDGLANFDGTRLFEQEDIHPDWQSSIFNNGRNEVIEFLISSALFWLDKYHVDGIRVDAVASMLYLDYSRAPGKWRPNFFGGHENLESIAFLRRLNDIVREKYPDVMMIAEESTSWRDVSRPSSSGGLSFDMKWNMGWMHDTLKFFQQNQKRRSKNLDELTYCFYYAFSEDYCLPLSHDEVVHEKASLLSKMPGKEAQKFNNLRVLYGFMFAHPGKKLLFMGAEIGQWAEWNHDKELDWHLLQYKRHQGIQQWLKDLNGLYRNEPALHSQDFTNIGFEWLDVGQNSKGVIAFMRKGLNNEKMMIVFNLSERAKKRYPIGLSVKEQWCEVLNSDAKAYNGKGMKNPSVIKAKEASHRGQRYCIRLKLPPLSVVFLKPFS